MHEEVNDPGLRYKLVLQATGDRDLAEDQSVQLISDQMRQER